jgi:thiamine-monophosphate kinase
MLIKEIGEFGLISRIKKSIKTNTSVIKGSGDDCAVLKFNKDKYQLFTCDMIVEDKDFTLKDDPYLVGRKAIAVSVSDIAACAGLPQHCVVSLGLPSGLSVEFTDKLLKGILHLLDEFNINLVGGDISAAKELVVDVSMLGVVEKKLLVLRNGARRGDVIFVTGPLGGSISGKHFKFTPRINEARYLVKNFKINSMIDISDGLTQDLGHIMSESSCGAFIYEVLIPKSRQAHGLNDALYSGEDFELLFTMSPKEAKKLLKKGLKYPKPIGEIVENKYGLMLVDSRGRKKKIQPRGFRHF